MQEQGLTVDHTMIYHWMQCYTTKLEKRCHSQSNPLMAPGLVPKNLNVIRMPSRSSRIMLAT